MFGSINIVKNSNKDKRVYSGYRIAFDGKGEWSFGNDYAKNIISFSVDNSSSSHTDNCKSNLISGKTPAISINGSLGSPDKIFGINFKKANTNIFFGLHFNGDNCYFFVNGKEIFRFKSDNKNFNFATPFYLGSVSYGFDATESREASLGGLQFSGLQ